MTASLDTPQRSPGIASPMTPERWKRLEGLYHTARDRPPAERAAFLADACRDDEALRQDVESLLDQNSTNGFLSKPALPDAPRAADFAPSPMVGRTIGGYLIRLCSASAAWARSIVPGMPSLGGMSRSSSCRLCSRAIPIGWRDLNARHACSRR